MLATQHIGCQLVRDMTHFGFVGYQVAIGFIENQTVSGIFGAEQNLWRPIFIEVMENLFTVGKLQGSRPLFETVVKFIFLNQFISMSVCMQI